MSSIRSFICLSAMCAMLFCSCRKDQTDRGLLDTRYHIGFRDPLTGKQIKGLKADLVQYQPWDKSPRTVQALMEDTEGNFVYTPVFGSGYAHTYVKLTQEGYADVFYQLNTSWPTGHPAHVQEGSNGPNVVYVDPFGNKGSDYYFQADIYRTATLEIHLAQVKDYPGLPDDPRWFNATIKGTDPLNAANTFGSFDLFGEGIKLSGTRKLDTVVRVSGYGNYLNRLQWEVYGVELIPSGLEDRIGRVPVTNGESPQVKYPADALTKISIAF